MKSLLYFIKKFDIIFVFSIYILLILISCFFYPNISCDEIWNFQNIYKMYNGFIIYKDCNIIITPIFFVIGNLLFKIFNANTANTTFKETLALAKNHGLNISEAKENEIINNI